MSRKRFRRLVSGQGWIEAPSRELHTIAAAVTSDQPESVIGIEGRVRVHRLPHVEAWGDRKRTNASGKVNIIPAGAVSRRLQ